MLPTTAGRISEERSNFWPIGVAASPQHGSPPGESRNKNLWRASKSLKTGVQSSNFSLCGFTAGIRIPKAETPCSTSTTTQLIQIVDYAPVTNCDIAAGTDRPHSPTVRLLTNAKDSPCPGRCTIDGCVSHQCEAILKPWLFRDRICASIRYASVPTPAFVHHEHRPLFRGPPEKLGLIRGIQ